MAIDSSIFAWESHRQRQTTVPWGHKELTQLSTYAGILLELFLESLSFYKPIKKCIPLSPRDLRFSLFALKVDLAKTKIPQNSHYNSKSFKVHLSIYLYIYIYIYIFFFSSSSSQKGTRAWPKHQGKLSWFGFPKIFSRDKLTLTLQKSQCVENDFSNW